MNKYLEKDLMVQGVGIFVTNLLGGQAEQLLKEVNNKTINNFSGEIVGGVFLVAGSLMLRKRKTKQFGAVIGAVGASIIANRLVDRVLGKGSPATTLRGSNGQTVTEEGRRVPPDFWFKEQFPEEARRLMEQGFLLPI